MCLFLVQQENVRFLSANFWDPIQPMNNIVLFASMSFCSTFVRSLSSFAVIFYTLFCCCSPHLVYVMFVSSVLFSKHKCSHPGQPSRFISRHMKLLVTSTIECRFINIEMIGVIRVIAVSTYDPLSHLLHNNWKMIIQNEWCDMIRKKFNLVSILAKIFHQDFKSNSRNVAKSKS